MPSYSRLVRTPQLLSLGRQRARVKNTVAPRTKPLRTLQVIEPPIDMVISPDGKYETYDPSIDLTTGDFEPTTLEDPTPEEAYLDWSAERRAPLGLKDLAFNKGLTAATKGLLGSLAGATPSQIAKAVVSSQMTPLAGLSLVNKFTAPAIAREKRIGAIKQAAKAYDTPNLAEAYDLATQDLVSQSIGMGPKGLEITEPTTEQENARQAVDQADVDLSNLNRSLMDLALQGTTNLAPQKLQDLFGYVETPVLSDVYSTPEDLSFEALSPEERAEIGASYVDPETGKEIAAEPYEEGPNPQREFSLKQLLNERIGSKESGGEPGPGEGGIGGFGAESDTPSGAVGSSEGLGLGGEEESLTDQEMGRNMSAGGKN